MALNPPAPPVNTPSPYLDRDPIPQYRDNNNHAPARPHDSFRLPPLPWEIVTSSPRGTPPRRTALGAARAAGVHSVDGEEKEVMPGGGGEGEYIHRGLRRLVVNSTLELAGLRVADFGGLVRLDWYGQWDAMDWLDTLFLDLESYSLPRNRYLYNDDVSQLARSLKGKGLALLVIAELRSWSRYPGPDPIEIEEVEEALWDDLFREWVSRIPGDKVNW
ncbi:hypothetical protein C8A05DRAFT_39959 [Staphylotrichum tortipilum]|uniref:Uncharacterized protein n=1 Tax=Staphylotrichum tortipilum TaxID=2831512 RepID=A0AAN6M8R1_9PEZI|nr:hypothetical protein C8A05DRAFT_39959 [Staphylotrichum longicolle]